jgi:hypothetical protein
VQLSLKKMRWAFVFDHQNDRQKLAEEFQGDAEERADHL